MIRNSLRSACALAALTAPLLAQSTIRLTAGLGGAEPNGASSEPSTSRDGRFVVFASDANNLVANDTSTTPDVFVYDRGTGFLELVSVRIGPGAASNTMNPTVSNDGNLICFESSAANLVPGDDPVSDIFLRDRTAGTTTRLTAGWNGNSTQPAMTPDGRYVAFTSAGENVVPSGTSLDIFRLDRQTGQFVLVSLTSAGGFGNLDSFTARLSDDGRYVAFGSRATNFGPADSNGVQDVFVRDTVALTTRRASLGEFSNQLLLQSLLGSLSADGTLICFDSADGNVTSGDTDMQDDVFVRNHVVSSVVRASTPPSRLGGGGTSNGGRISSDGRWVLFRSTGADLAPSDPTPGEADAYLKNLQTGAVEIVSLAADGTPRATQRGLALSDDARWIVFESSEAVVPGDAAGLNEIYLRDRGAPLYTTPCAGDGSSTPCPCGNPGSPGSGCENYAIGGGVRLSATGCASITNDTLRLSGNGFVSLPTPLGFVQGDALVNGGQGVPFGDGVQCVGGSTLRFGRRNALGGSVAFGAGVAGDAPVSVAGHVDTPGVTRYYQIAYFNFGSFCGQLRRNWSNSIAIVWGP